MADQDEDTIVRNDIDPETNDIADETQDFRFLSSLSQSKTDYKIPKRGEKDFEHHGTRSQEEVLNASRQAMHDVLAPPRIHKSHPLTGYFDPDNGGDCVIEEPKGAFLATMGRSDAHNRTYLLPEECLYLVERGTLNLQWRTDRLRDTPVSLQTAYAYLIGNQGLTLERYVVYAGLKRLGYIVQRSATWYPEDRDKMLRQQPPAPSPTPPPSLYSRMSALLFPPRPPPPPPPPLGPLIQPGLYRSYTPIYASLGKMIPFHDPRLRGSTSSEQHHPVLRPSFNVYKPSTTHFRKASPPAPHFRICVLNARDDPFPSCEQLDGLLACMPYEPPPEGSEGKTYQRVRHGYRSVVLAVVDAGVVSYVRVGESGMGCEPVWDRDVRPMVETGPNAYAQMGVWSTEYGREHEKHSA
ncbi:MAG: tRNA-splicing endonuclease subunit sen54 [Ramalina farinacea]|uniref:tRNA-splicing endonuclease subunit sen54 n=1 Tax=Ramalina farinacea TaxID=258253 RepID=A0AA43QLK4_9LECA|nr:tRNA-splicing endonuclease subunit sen54 [Ramalina farinacea]